jgi:hypothetical protein
MRSNIADSSCLDLRLVMALLSERMHTCLMHCCTWRALAARFGELTALHVPFSKQVPGGAVQVLGVPAHIPLPLPQTVQMAVKHSMVSVTKKYAIDKTIDACAKMPPTVCISSFSDTQRMHSMCTGYTS